MSGTAAAPASPAARRSAPPGLQSKGHNSREMAGGHGDSQAPCTNWHKKPELNVAEAPSRAQRGSAAAALPPDLAAAAPVPPPPPRRAPAHAPCTARTCRQGGARTGAQDTPVEPQPGGSQGHKHFCTQLAGWPARASQQVRATGGKASFKLVLLGMRIPGTVGDGKLHVLPQQLAKLAAQHLAHAHAGAAARAGVQSLGAALGAAHPCGDPGSARQASKPLSAPCSLFACLHAHLPAR